jgi:mannose/cellobiose epimerase-like protein (N-acyl-D-glucosamine 2-epimerase family)
MTVFSEIFASDFATTILAISSAPVLIGLAAFAVTLGRRIDAALDNAFDARKGHAGQPDVPHPAKRWDRHPVKTSQRGRRTPHLARNNSAPAELCSTL